MKALIVCGSRDWTDVAMIRGWLDEIFYERDPHMVIIEGQARGADKIAGQWADDMASDGVLHAKFDADWKRYGRGAGPIRNGAMLEHLLAQRQTNGDDIEVLAFHDDLEGSGTANMVDQARKAGVAVRIMSHDD